MPRVGSSKMTTRLSRASHLPTTTFCWLPPDRLPASISSLGILMEKFCFAVCTISVTFLRFTTPSLLQAMSRFGSSMLERMESFTHRPSFLRSSGASTTPWRMASMGFLILISLPSSQISPDSLGSTPKIARVVSVRPAPIRPAKPRISPS